MLLYLLRHGETDYLKAKISQGWSDSRLTDFGKTQVRASAIWLARQEIQQIYASDLLRARESVDEVVQCCDAPVEFKPQLRELGHGIFEGTPTGTLKKQVHGDSFDWVFYKPKNGESVYEFGARTRRAFYQFQTHDKVLWVTHGGVIAQVVSMIEGKRSDQFLSHIPSEGSVTLIDTEKSKIVLRNQLPVCERVIDYM